MNTDTTPQPEPSDAPTGGGPSTTPPSGPGPLRRPRRGRFIAGVGAGLAQRLDLPTWLIRALLVVLSFAGGFGIALYVAGWLLIPEEGSDQPIASGLLDRVDSATAWVGLGLIAVAALVIADNLWFLRGDLIVAAVLIVAGVLLYRGDIGPRRTGTVDRGDGPDDADPGPPPPPQPPADAGDGDEGGPTHNDGDDGSTGDGGGSTGGGSTPAPPPSPSAPPRPRSVLGRATVAFTLIAVGVMGMIDLATPRFDPGARHYLALALAVIGVGLVVGAWVGRARGLIVAGVLLVPLLALSPIAELDLAPSIGQQVFSPDTAAELRERYRHGIGELVVDLTDLELTPGETITVDAEVNIGQVRVLVPADAAVEATGSVRVGDVELLDRSWSGVGADGAVSALGRAGTIVLDLHADFGQVELERGGDGAVPTGGADLGLGERDLEVNDAADLAPAYQLAAGSLRLDLSALELTEPRSVDIEMGTGEVEVILPEDQPVRVTARTGLGDIELLGRSERGIDVELSAQTDRDDGPFLDLSIEVGAGDIDVREGRG